MSANAKRLAAMRRNPKADWTQSDVIAAAEGAGCIATHHGGSHMQIAHPARTEILTVPARRPIKPIYIKRLITFIDRISEMSQDD